LGPPEEGTRSAGRATLCAGPDDRARHELVFAAYFDHRTGLPRPRPAAPATTSYAAMPLTEATGAAEGPEEPDVVRA
ncbi:hypothetical protein QWY29_20675, partial [Nocardioides sp. SOB72]|nr:hypothetical protein [Nocardioides abyssi]